MNTIAEAAQRDTDDMNQGIQQFALYAYFPQDANWVPRKIFRVAPSDIEIERDVTPSEPATEKGLVAQTMRHLESVMKTHTVGVSYIVQAQQRELQRLSEQNEAFSKQQVDFMLLLQDTMNDAHTRRRAEKSNEVDIAIKESAMSKLEALVPVVINRIAGSQVLPTEDKSFMLMASLLEGLTDEQQASFLGGLSEGQRIIFAEVLTEYEKKKSKFIEGQKKASRPLGTKNSLPPSSRPTNLNEQKQLTDGDEKPRPLSMFMTFKERLENPTPIINRDPVLEKLEDDASAFMNRFREQLSPKKKPTTGE